MQCKDPLPACSFSMRNYFTWPLTVFLPSYSTEGRKEGEKGWKKRRRKRGMERQKEKQRTRLEPVIFDLELGVPSYTCLLYSWLKI